MPHNSDGARPSRNQSMRIVCLSDTHNLHDRITVPDGDVLVHCGDATGVGSFQELTDFLGWYGRLPHRHKILVAGNHDHCLERDGDICGMILAQNPGITYLQDSGCEIGGVRFWGSPWQPWFNNWAFNLPRGGERIRGRWNLIPMDTDVLITHGPPHGILDEVRPRMTAWGIPEEGSDPLGCEELAIRLAAVRPRLHLFGHIHDGFGTALGDATTYVNASVCDEDYRPVNPARVIDLPREGAPRVLQA